MERKVLVAEAVEAYGFIVTPLRATDASPWKVVTVTMTVPRIKAPEAVAVALQCTSEQTALHPISTTMHEVAKQGTLRLKMVVLVLCSSSIWVQNIEH